MGVGAGFVTEPDTEVLDLLRLLLADLSDGKDFATGLLGLTDTLHEEPELGTSHGGSAGAHLHAENLRIGLSLGGSSASNDLELLDDGLHRLRLERKLDHGGIV